jgi:hypothetical protein
MKGRIGKLYRFKLRFGKNVPHIIWDGLVDDKDKETKALCISENTNASFANINAGDKFKNISRDMSLHNCTLKVLPPVILTIK